MSNPSLQIVACFHCAIAITVPVPRRVADREALHGVRDDGRSDDGHPRDDVGHRAPDQVDDGNEAIFTCHDPWS